MYRLIDYQALGLKNHICVPSGNGDVDSVDSGGSGNVSIKQLRPVPDHCLGILPTYKITIQPLFNAVDKLKSSGEHKTTNLVHCSPSSI